ncbi:MAG: hypothetical protein LC808_40855 [Actinobacteria bacterium]|nr:hypothetical protein [Actinomycetota bacterium]
MRPMRILVVLAFLAVALATVAVAFTVLQGGTHDATRWTWIHDLLGKDALVVKPGESGADGNLRFQVVGVDCRATGVDDRCVARVHVRNADSAKATLDTDLQYLVFDDITVPSASIHPSADIEKGSSATMKIVWEHVPQNGLRRVELHESLLSNGVRVELSKDA